ncbi:MAG: cyclic pyranopterin monophosphate synthase MoaC [Bacteroidota bacterium]
MKEFSHTDKEGKAKMVDVGQKKIQKRIARAEGFIQLQPKTVELIRKNEMKKGDVLTVSEIAGIQAAKRTSEWIPLCHPLPVDQVHVTANLKEEGVWIQSEALYTGKTGVEMEALTAVNAALLTVYDMCKAVDNNMEIGNIRLVEKRKEDKKNDE